MFGSKNSPTPTEHGSQFEKRLQDRLGSREQRFSEVRKGFTKEICEKIGKRVVGNEAGVCSSP